MTELRNATQAEIDEELNRRKVEVEKTKDIDWQMANLTRLWREGQIDRIIPSRVIKRASHDGIGNHVDMQEIGHFAIRIKNPKLEVFNPYRRFP